MKRWSKMPHTICSDLWVADDKNKYSFFKFKEDISLLLVEFRNSKTYCLL